MVAASSRARAGRFSGTRRIISSTILAAGGAAVAQLVEGRALGRAGAHDIDSDAEAPDLARQRLGESDESAMRRRGHGRAALPDLAAVGADRQDAAGFLLHHVRHHGVRRLTKAMSCASMIAMPGRRASARRRARSRLPHVRPRRSPARRLAPDAATSPRPSAALASDRRCRPCRHGRAGPDARRMREARRSAPDWSDRPARHHSRLRRTHARPRDRSRRSLPG